MTSRRILDMIVGIRHQAKNDPISYLVVPRFGAMIISLVVLTVIFNTVALLSASFVGDMLMEVDYHTFWFGLTDVFG